MKAHVSKKKLYLLAATVLAMSLVLSSFSWIALGEGGNFKKLDIMIKPEYDVEKQVFLRFDGEIGEASMPTEAFFYTPKDIIEDSSLEICAFSASNQMLCQTREKSTEGNFYKFKVPMPEKKFMLEGYFESLKDNNGKRTLEYTFKAAQDIEELHIGIAKPKEASNFTVKPSPHSSGSDNDDLENSTYSFSDVKEGKEYKFNISYTKNNWDVSVEKTEGTSTNESATDSGISSSGIFIAIFIAIILAGGALFVFSRFGQQSSRKPLPVGPKGKARFCTNCGTRLSTDSKFCANCGTKLN